MLFTEIKNRSQKTIGVLSQISIVCQKEQTLSAAATLTIGLSQFSIEQQALFQFSNTIALAKSKWDLVPGHLYLEHTLTPCCICRNSWYTSLITKPVLFLNYLTQYWSSSELFKAICKRFSVIHMQRLLRNLLNILKLPEPNISSPCSTALTQGEKERAYSCPIAS